jgi:glycosyltransferase involved in cell wall biosynthesis
MKASSSQLVLIPSYNSGRKLAETVTDALAFWRPVWVVLDGSTDGSDAALAGVGGPDGDLRVLRLPENRGKGAAVLAGMEAAAAAGFAQILVMDADGQHPADRIPLFMQAASAHPDAMVLGVPQFGSDAPASRRKGRLAGNWWTNLETLWGGIHDSLFGFRVYPIRETLHILHGRRAGRGYDFDTVTVVRLFWAGVRPINIPVPVRYFAAADGGVSHFRYLRHNLLLIWRHTGMVLEMVLRWPAILRYRRRALALGCEWSGAPVDVQPPRVNS